jgi:hypothetical protein
LNDSFSDNILSKFTNLTHLDIQRCSQISNNGISNLINLKFIRPNYNITRSCIRSLTNLINLHEYLEQREINDDNYVCTPVLYDPF